ncbi:MAG: 50S ribosomal protein L3 [Candidatus Colwellbacteria bacterium CG10_big_fil_rev_8_21_14_0_10_42_22]|uniref:Large ribosomal subunit protein uL3 n=1 Tax=Candidatus Colwellbacteria bacterium CG10_big_fil_rev_8_21_14_0_10_42_22 TaxID=1974540 RepID=A0A2H0VF98_9BACT|nr:MAG: 50S ribosomal protein L3 [Candidatus Colwellbacteria bacterium CG10_big_fil_rev_8_21_14_0_10_42_22]
MKHTEGKKIKMGQVFHEENVIPVTFIELIGEEQLDFEVGEKVKVSGKSKGRGFQGVVKRHGFAGGPKSHGQKHTLRAGGSIGSTGPQRVLPGVKMPGRMGNTKVNLKNVEVIAHEKDRQMLVIKGALPGMKGSLVKIYKKTLNSEK